MNILLPVTLLNKDKLRKWKEEREKQLEEEYKNEPLEIERLDIIAMIIAAFQVLTPIFLIAVVMLSLAYLLFFGV